MSLPRPVKLHWSPKSPFVRKVRITLAECGLASDVQLLRTIVDRINPDIAYMSINPLGTIPALELSNGEVLVDSNVICEYLLALTPTQSLLPHNGHERFQVLRRQALADGAMDALLFWRQECIRPEDKQNIAVHRAYQTKTNAALDYFEHAARQQPAELDLGQIALGCALAYLDLRFPDLDWRHNRPELAHWHQHFEARPAARATALSLGDPQPSTAESRL